MSRKNRKKEKKETAPGIPKDPFLPGPVMTGLIVVSALCYLAGDMLDMRSLIYVFKPMTMVLIIAMAWQRTPAISELYKSALILALVCSLLGDVFLMFQKSDQIWFLSGMASFFLAHVLFATAFTFQKPPATFTWYAYPILIYGSAILALVFPHLGSLRVPVLLYMGALSLMACQAINRWKASPGVNTELAAYAAMLFVISDSLLALNKFYAPFSGASLAIMGTYFLSQYLFAKSV
ncbi:MAG: lysoplasmalogenase [Blastocatellia bacterium]|nr:lysoplasmalogenase [Blastocatellia bacterium]